MDRKYFTALLLITAVCFFLILIFFLQKPPKKEQDVVVTEVVPFPSYVIGVGIVEPASGNITLGIPFNRIIKKIDVAVNDRVNKGDVILELDNRDLLANQQVKQSSYEKALANLQKLEQLPRKEDLIIAEENLNKAKIAVTQSKQQYDMVTSLQAGAISQEERDRRYFQYQQAETNLKNAEAEYQKVKSGTWQPDLKVAQFQVEQAKTDLEAIQSEIERTVIKSPIDGTVLQMKLHEGEIPSGNPAHAVVIGNIDALNVRVNIDQFNATNIIPELFAVAFRQGLHSSEYPLEFLHIEPLMIPKKYLTNAIDEQVDTQVLQVVYRVNKEDPDLFIGEKLDVYIDTKK